MSVGTVKSLSPRNLLACAGGRSTVKRRSSVRDCAVDGRSVHATFACTGTRGAPSERRSGVRDCALDAHSAHATFSRAWEIGTHRRSPIGRARFDNRSAQQRSCVHERPDTPPPIEHAVRTLHPFSPRNPLRARRLGTHSRKRSPIERESSTPVQPTQPSRARRLGTHRRAPIRRARLRTGRPFSHATFSRAWEAGRTSRSPIERVRVRRPPPTQPSRVHGDSETHRRNAPIERARVR